MDGKKLIIICFIISFLGLFLIYFYDEFIDVCEYELSSVDKDLIGEYIKVCGMFDGYKFVGDNLSIILFNEESKVNVFMFENDFLGINLYSFISDDVCVFGRVEYYKNDVIIYADKIE
jgi:hypothetical protein